MVGNHKFHVISQLYILEYIYIYIYIYELLLGTRGTPVIYSKMHNICRLGMHIVLGPQSRQGNFA